MKTFSGRLLLLDRSDINTDEIIPAKYLTEIKRRALKPHLLEDLKLDGFDPKVDLADVSAIVSRSNFGCGSSREHAAWALEANGIHLVIAESFARIFRQNMFNCGLLAVELPGAIISRLFDAYGGATTMVTADVDASSLTFTAAQRSESVPFVISDFDRALIDVGGWVAYADARY